MQSFFAALTNKTGLFMGQAVGMAKD